jgi:hypothetical protein
MKTTLSLMALCLLFTCPAIAEESGFQDPLIDKLAGDWVMQGAIGGDESTHDISAEWVLAHQYLRFHDVARELDEAGRPLYEATVFIGWDEPSSSYACLWLDSTGGGGLSGEAIGHAKANGDELPFLFKGGDGSIFQNTFVYHRDSDTWEWRMDAGAEGNLQPFARVTLTRK